MKRQKLYYIPGLISLIGLPILLFFWGPGDPVRHTSMRVFLPTDKKDSAGLVRFSEDGFYKLLKKKKIVTIDLNTDHVYGDNLGDYLFYQKMNFVTREFEQLQFTNDTNTVLKVELGEDNTFGEFIWIFNQAIIYRIRRFAFMNDNFYFLTNPPIVHYPPEAIDLPVPSLDSDFLAGLPPPPTKWDLFKRDLNNKLEEISFIIRHNYTLTIGFLLLIIAPGIVRLRKTMRPKITLSLNSPPHTS